MERNEIYDISEVELAAVLLGKEMGTVTLDEESLRRLLELANKETQLFTEQDLIDDTLLSAKFSVYMSQNDLWHRDPYQLLKELLGTSSVQMIYSDEWSTGMDLFFEIIHPGQDDILYLTDNI